MHGRAATQSAAATAPGRPPSPATTPISRSWATDALSRVQALAIRAVLDPATAAGITGEVMSALGAIAKIHGALARPRRAAAPGPQSVSRCDREALSRQDPDAHPRNHGSAYGAFH
jgi:hypothetical protein